MTRIIVPFLDANIPDVTVVKWLKGIGETVRAGEVVAEVSTDKAAFEIEAPADGTLLRVFAPEKSIVPVKYVLAIVGADGEEDASAVADNATLMDAYRAAASASAALPSATAMPPLPASATRVATGASHLRATPKARRYAQSNGIDLAEVARATGATMITEAVLMKYVEARS